jgi:3-hydroxyisobutyrate dehydrogenase-like beta-hydroxyacid dehydrogenase
MCANLVNKGNLDKPLILYNRTKQRSDDLAAKLGDGKTKVVETVGDAVKESDVILMCLGDDAAVNSTVDAILEQDVKGKLIVDCSTVHPDTTNALEKRITEKGAEFVGMPGVYSSNLMRPISDKLQCLAPPPWPTLVNLSACLRVPGPA